MAYVTLAEIKYFIGKNLQGNTDEDTLLTSLIAQAQAVIDSYCGGKPPRTRTFEASGDTTRKYNAIGDVIGKTLYLHADLAQTPTTVSNNGSTYSVDTHYVLLCDIAPHTPPYSRIQLISADWSYTTTPINAITVTGRFAYSITPPNDIKLACLELVNVTYKQRDTVAGVFTAMTAENGAVMFPDGAAKRVLDRLEPYVWR